MLSLQPRAKYQVSSTGVHYSFYMRSLLFWCLTFWTFTSWLWFYFALTVDGSIVSDDELEAVRAYSRYYLTSWLNRGKENQESLRTICPQTRIRIGYLSNTSINPHTGFAQHCRKLQLAFRQRSALSERVSSYEYTKSYSVPCLTVEANSWPAWSYVGRSCSSSPTVGSTVKKLFWVGKNFHPSYIIQIFIFLYSWFICYRASVSSCKTSSFRLRSDKLSPYVRLMNSCLLVVFFLTYFVFRPNFTAVDCVKYVFWHYYNFNPICSCYVIFGLVWSNLNITKEHQP